MAQHHPSDDQPDTINLNPLWLAMSLVTWLTIVVCLNLRG
jgi:hypothetical protein